METTFQTFLTTFLPNIPYSSAVVVIELTKEGGTVPFIARYRKEKTGNLDEVQIREILDLHETFEEVVKRKQFLIKEIHSQGNLTDELKARIEASMNLEELNEIYRPFKRKKKTKATLARDAGLEPFSQWIWDLGHGLIQDSTAMEVRAKEYINLKAQFVTYDLVLKGTMDILVERIANTPHLRDEARKEFFENGKIHSKKTKKFKEHSKYAMYAEHEESVSGLMDKKASHRYLAMRRAWQEDEVTLSIHGDEEKLLKSFEHLACTQQNQTTDFLKQCAKQALNVHVLPSISTEVHSALKEKADDHAITVFSENVRRVLLGSPFGARCILGVDPGLRTGCKIALVDKAGRYISHTVFHIKGDDAEEKAKKLFGEVFKQIKIDGIAVGNGTAGRETETFVRKLVKDLGENIPVIMVNESGASVYSASDIAREEFPDLDITVRGAISIARRLQDPLAELVKIDPKSIGVGQYQHDVSATRLKKSLHGVVESCVNNVGVDLNTASESLLSYVSGIGEGLAKRIIDHRKQHGLYKEREEILKVPHFSTKVFEQSAGFLRILGGAVVLDQTGVHPERYSAVREMAHELGVSVSQLVGSGATSLNQLREKWSKLIGPYTFDDIVKELESPSRDPRDPFKVFAFRDDILEVKDLKEGMICPGIVTNVTNFGAFVDIGVHQDGLVHISALAQKFVDDPRKVVNPGDQVTVKVLGIDLDKNQISLSMNWDKPTVQREARSERGPRKDAGLRKDAGSRSKHPTGSGRSVAQGQTQSNRSRRSQEKHPSAQGKQSSPHNMHVRNRTPFNNPFAALNNVKSKPDR